MLRRYSYNFAIALRLFEFCLFPYCRGFCFPECLSRPSIFLHTPDVVVSFYGCSFPCFVFACNEDDASAVFVSLFARKCSVICYGFCNILLRVSVEVGTLLWTASEVNTQKLLSKFGSRKRDDYVP